MIGNLHPARSDAAFERQLKDSWIPQLIVARWLRRHGFRVKMEQISCRNRGAEAQAAIEGRFPDRPDVWLTRQRCRIEVKSKKQRFTGPHDFPFQTVFICNDASMQKIAGSNYRTVAVVIVSQPTQELVCIPWRPERWRRCPMRQGTFAYEGWEAPRECLRSMRWLLRRKEAIEYGPLFIRSVVEDPSVS